MSTDKRDLRSGRRRAAYAGVYPWITEAWGKDAMKLAQGLPVTLRSQGLMITLATLQGKDGRAHRALAQLVAQRLLDSQPALVKLVPLADGKANEVRRLLAACANPAGTPTSGWPAGGATALPSGMIRRWARWR